MKKNFKKVIMEINHINIETRVTITYDGESYQRHEIKTPNDIKVHWCYNRFPLPDVDSHLEKILETEYQK